MVNLVFVIYGTTFIKCVVISKFIDVRSTSSHIFVFNLTGCACRFLYGPETKDDHKGQIEKSLDGKIELKLEVIFYKKNGKLDSKTSYDFIYIDIPTYTYEGT